jgi:hypothetical protein
MPTHWIVFSEKFDQPNLIPKKFIFPCISPSLGLGLGVGVGVGLCLRKPNPNP